MEEDAAAPAPSSVSPTGLSVDTSAPRRHSRIVASSTTSATGGGPHPGAPPAFSDAEFMARLAKGLGCEPAVAVALAASELLQTASPRDLLAGPMTLRCV